MKVLPANSVEVAHNKEAFILVFRFQASDGQAEAVYIVLSPSGAKTTADLLGREIQLYEKEAGAITPWTTQKTNNSTGPNHLST
jgi:hypothetical protein